MRRSRTRDLIILVLLLVLGIGGTYIAVRGQELKSTQAKIETVKVQRGSISATIGATGNTHARQSAILTWQTSGTVAALAVKVGDVVQAGQPLASLDPTTLPPSILRTQADLIDAQKALLDLQQSASARASAQATLVNAQKSLNDALVVQSQLNNTYASPANIDVAQGRYDLAQVQLNQAEQIYSLFEGRPQEDVQRLQAASQVERAKRLLNDALINLQYAKSKPDAQTASQVNAAVDVAKAQVQDAQREFDRLKNGPSPQDLTAAQARIDADQAALSARTVSAPIAGTVTQVDSQVGDMVSSGDTVMRVEDLTQMHVLVPIPEVDINRVRLDQPVALTFDAIPDRQYQGMVINIARFGTSQQGGVNFNVEVQIDNTDLSIKPGLTAAVTITVAQAKDTLIVPNRALRFSQGQRVVYVERGGQVVAVPVQLGITDDLNSQVLSGDLKEGETILANPPASTPGQ